MNACTAAHKFGGFSDWAYLLIIIAITAAIIFLLVRYAIRRIWLDRHWFRYRTNDPYAMWNMWAQPTTTFTVKDTDVLFTSRKSFLRMTGRGKRYHSYSGNSERRR